MKKFQILPSLPLQAYIDRIWGWESEVGEIVQLPELVVGTGAELYFHYGTPFHYRTSSPALLTCSQAHLFCIRQQPLALMPSNALGFVAVRFKAGMLSHFTHVATGELLDRVTTLEDIWGKSARSLSRHMEYTNSVQERLGLIQQFLLKQLLPELPDAVMTRLRLCFTSNMV